MGRDSRRRLLRRNDRDHLEFDDVTPIRHPFVEKNPVVAIHHLKAALEVGGHPARKVPRPWRSHAPLLLEAAIHWLRITITVLLDHHEEHLRSPQAVDGFSARTLSDTRSSP